MSEFFYMGGHAEYIWPAYGITAVMLTLSIVLPMIQRKQITKRIQRMLEQEQD